MKFQNILYGAVASLLLLASCAQTHENAEQVDHYPNMYPDYADVTIPVNIAPLNFEIRDKHLTNIETILTIEGADANDADNTLTATSNSQNMKFDLDDWKAFLQKAVNKNVKVQIYSKSDDGEWTAFKSFKWQVVGDSIDPYLTYRLIEPDYEVWNKIQIRQRCVENWKETINTDYHLQENRCMDCHTFGNQNPNLSMVNVRGEGGGAILNRNGKLRKLNLKTANMVSSSVYYWFDPSCRYVTFSTNIIIPAFHANPDKRLEVYDSKSDVYVADLDNNTIISSPLTSDSTKLETFPTFSSNGRYIYYCVADKKGLKTKNLKGLKYALVRIPFEDRTVTFGSKVDTLYTERSVCHPKISPDGRYCLFTVADYGSFPIWHPEADLRMLYLQTGKIDSLSIVNSQKSDTYHSWSHSGRWFVFASKRDDGLYGKPYFCYFDEHGMAFIPFVLLLLDLTFYFVCLKSFNIPELSRGPVPFNAIDIENVMKQEAEKFK